MLIFFGVHGEKQNNREKDPSGSKVVAMNKLKTALARRIVYSRTRATLPSSRTVIDYQYAALKVSCTPQHLSSVDEAQAQIDGFTFVGKSRTSGQGGAVGASNISTRILIATLNRCYQLCL